MAILSDLPQGEFSRIFGERPAFLDTGRSRLCKSCGDWHRLDRPWPHNCREPAPPRSHLAAPQIAPPFLEFMIGRTDTAVHIGSRNDKREYMERHDLVEFDDGVKPDVVSDREYERELVQDFKRAMEEDPLNRPPVERIGETDTEGAGEISIDAVEVAP